MKRIFLLCTILLAFISCEEDKVYYNGNTFVTFNNGVEKNISTNENIGTFNLPVSISEIQSTDVLVDLAYTDDTAIIVTNYSGPSSVTIPAGETSAMISITIVNDDLLNTTRKFAVSISSVSIPGIDIGLSGDEGTHSKIVSIINDDCPTQFGYWIASLSIEDVGYGSTPGTGAPNDNGDCDALVVVNNLPGMPSPTNNTYVVLFQPTNAEGTEGTVTVNETPSRTGLTSGGQAVTAVYVGSGTFSTITGEVIIDYQVQAKSVATGAILGNYWTGTNILRLP